MGNGAASCPPGPPTFVYGAAQPEVRVQGGERVYRKMCPFADNAEDLPRGESHLLKRCKGRKIALNSGIFKKLESVSKRSEKPLGRSWLNCSSVDSRWRRPREKRAVGQLFRPRAAADGCVTSRGSHGPACRPRARFCFFFFFFGETFVKGEQS